MDSFVVGIDLGEKESDRTYMSPDSEIRKDSSFPRIEWATPNSKRRYRLNQGSH